MAIDEPIEAIVAEWDAQSLDGTFAGGVWAYEAPQNVSFPYVVLFPIDVISVGWSSHSGLERERIQFSVFYKEVASADPISALKSLIRTLRGVYDDATLGLTGSDAGNIYGLEWTSQSILKESDITYHGRIDYVVKRRRPARKAS